MNDLQSYDADLEMFRQESRPVNFAHLRFLRWLSEQGRLEHVPVAPPGGEFAPRHRIAWLTPPERQIDGLTLELEEVDHYDPA
jgi:hypothetical protein